MNTKPLTPQQISDAARLRTLFQRWQLDQQERGLPSSQAEAAEFLGFGQSAVSQYLKGTIPLNFRAASNFARLMGCTIEDISPSIADQAKHLTERVADSRKTYHMWRAERGDPAPTRRARAPEPENPAGADKLPLLDMSQVDMWVRKTDSTFVIKKWYRPPVDVSDGSFFLHVPGESMMDPASPLSLRDGDLVLIDNDVIPGPGSVVLVRLHTGGFIIRQMISEGSELFLKALNPSWPDRIMRVEGRDQIAGTVMAKVVVF